MYTTYVRECITLHVYVYIYIYIYIYIYPRIHTHILAYTDRLTDGQMDGRDE